MSQPTIVCDQLMKKTMLSSHECRLTIGKEKMALQHNYMGASKASSYVMELNKE